MRDWQQERPIIGLDPSLSHTAAHWAPGASALEGTAVVGYATFTIKSELKQFPHRVARLCEIRRQLFGHVRAITSEHGPGAVFVEGYSFGARNDRETLGEWGGLIRLCLFDLGWDVVEVPPTTLKKYVTGRGVAEKDGMRMEALSRWGYRSADNNDCDAYALMRLGFDFQQWRRGVPVTKDLAQTLSKLRVLGADVAVEPPKAKRRRRRLLEAS